MVLGIISVIIGAIIFIATLAKGVETVQQQTVQHLDFIWASLFVIGGFIMMTIVKKTERDDEKTIKNNPVSNKGKQFIMWDCPKCNNANPNNVFVCEKCGYKLN